MMNDSNIENKSSINQSAIDVSLVKFKTKNSKLGPRAAPMSAIQMAKDVYKRG